MKAFVSGCEGLSLTADEVAFFADQQPFGLILFKRNCDSRDQLRGLIARFREAVGREDAQVLIDQEGGRVQRMGPPHWRAYPPARSIGDLYLEDPEEGRRAGYLLARLIAGELAEVGFSIDCLPVLDVTQPDVHKAIGDRGFGSDPGIVAVLGRAIADGLRDGGILPVIKHMPGHGRARVDSHHDLPVVDAEIHDLEDTDFRPFQELKTLPIGMTCHLVYTAIDPDRPATHSPVVIADIIRGTIGFEGLLLTDDLSMNALAGTIAERAANALQAGCDIALHCNGELDEMIAVADVSPELAGTSLERVERARDWLRPAEPFDAVDGYAELNDLVGVSGT